MTAIESLIYYTFVSIFPALVGAGLFVLVSKRELELKILKSVLVAAVLSAIIACLFNLDETVFLIAFLLGIIAEIIRGPMDEKKTLAYRIAKIKGEK